MKDSIVRIESITINNFKNVTHGQLDFENKRKAYRTSILGLYGQNGSGKTALIDVIELLKLALTGQPIPVKFADYISVDAELANVKYEFKVENKGRVFNATYEFSLMKDNENFLQNIENSELKDNQYEVRLFNEVLSYAYESESEKSRLSPLIDTRKAIVFVPQVKLDCLVGKDKEILTELVVAKRMAFATSRSYIFSKEFLSVIRTNCDKNNRVDAELERHMLLIESLVQFGNFELFIINTSNSGLISMNALPLAFKYEDKNIGAVGNMMIPLNAATTIPEEMLDVAQNVIRSMNIVLSQIVPGLTISIKELGQEVLKNGKIGARIQLISNKNSKEIPLQYESEGIKKLVSILQLLIVVYNKPSITVAIDELDAGVFEYLLGEVLHIISEKGKGQLIFTSHNLRPLETLDRGFVAFTTTNPNNRYIRFSHVRDTNNLRDFYFRDIVLGEQSEEVYDATNNYEIALAFREAGELCGA